MFIYLELFFSGKKQPNKHPTKRFTS